MRSEGGQDVHVSPLPCQFRIEDFRNGTRHRIQAGVIGRNDQHLSKRLLAGVQILANQFTQLARLDRNILSVAGNHYTM